MNVVYKKFRTGDVLTFNSSKGVFHSINVIIDNKKTKDNYPYVVRTSKNNGIRGYINEDVTKLNPANTISFAQDTAQMFYQEEPYFTGNKVKILSIKDYEMDEKIAIFLISCLNKAFSNFTWGSSYDTKILVEVPLGLPIKVDDNNEPVVDKEKKYHKDGYVPDFDYMRERIIELERERIIELERYLLITGLNDCEFTEEDVKILSSFGNNEKTDSYSGTSIYKEMREFKLENLFISESGDTDLQKAHINGLGYNVVSSGLENNGVIGKTDVKAKVLKSNTITIDMFGNAFYRDMPYKMVTHGRVFSLSPKFNNFNELNGQFIVSALKYLPLVYNYSNMCSWNKIRMNNLYLPIQTDGNNNPIIDTTHQYHTEGYIPDWEFMEKYIKIIEKIVITDVVKYKDDYIEKTKMVVNK